MDPPASADESWQLSAHIISSVVLPRMASTGEINHVVSFDTKEIFRQFLGADFVSFHDLEAIMSTSRSSLSMHTHSPSVHLQPYYWSDYPSFIGLTTPHFALSQSE